MYVLVLKVIIEVIISVIIFFSFFALLFNYCNWKINMTKTAPRVSFKTFKTMYELNQNSFILASTFFKHNYHLAEFNSYISLLRYYLFKHNLNKEYSKERRRERTEELIESFQKDIDDYKEQQKSELKQYSDAIIKQVKESTERYEKLKSELDDDYMIGGIYEFWKISTNETMTKSAYFISIEDEEDWKNQMMLKGWTLIKKVILTYGENNR